MIERLNKLKQTREQYSNGGVLLKAVKTDAALRAEIEVLTQHYLGRKVSGCSNCYMDAYLELIHLSDTKAMSKDNTHFHLRAGVLLRDVVNFDTAKNMTNANITDELALYHLRTNPSCKDLFDTLPDNIEELLNPDTKATTTDIRNTSTKRVKKKN